MNGPHISQSTNQSSPPRSLKEELPQGDEKHILPFLQFCNPEEMKVIKTIILSDLEAEAKNSSIEGALLKNSTAIEEYCNWKRQPHKNVSDDLLSELSESERQMMTNPWNTKTMDDTLEERTEKISEINMENIMGVAKTLLKSRRDTSCNDQSIIVGESLRPDINSLGNLCPQLPISDTLHTGTSEALDLSSAEYSNSEAEREIISAKIQDALKESDSLLDASKYPSSSTTGMIAPFPSNISSMPHGYLVDYEKQQYWDNTFEDMSSSLDSVRTSETLREYEQVVGSENHHQMPITINSGYFQLTLEERQRKKRESVEKRAARSRRNDEVLNSDQASNGGNEYRRSSLCSVSHLSIPGIPRTDSEDSLGSDIQLCSSNGISYGESFNGIHMKNNVSERRDSTESDISIIEYIPHRNNERVIKVVKEDKGILKSEKSHNLDGNSTANSDQMSPRITDKFTENTLASENSATDKMSQNSLDATKTPESSPKSLNILLLGETGVGKTTFINSLVNYLTHPNLESIMEVEPKLLTNIAFTIVNENDQMIHVRHNSNYEQIDLKHEKFTENGESSTEEPVVHSASWNVDGKAKLLNIIDTPGIGDTRGIVHDEQNFDRIIECIRTLNELHAICILLKPNQARVTASFRYYFESLLTRLHRNATKNILFCFTNTRSTLYRPGDTLSTLKHYLKTLEKEKGIVINLDKHNIFCFDNDCFRYVLAAKYRAYERIPEQDNLFDDGWKRNVTEALRLLRRVECIPIHNTQDTVDINKTHQIITLLAQPLAQIAQNHIANIHLIQDYMKQINDLKSVGGALEEQLSCERIEIVSVPLHRPRTVCTSPRCTTYKTILDHPKIEKYKICHDDCSSEFSPKHYLLEPPCSAFYKDGEFKSICRECGCGKSWHKKELTERKLRKVKQANRHTEEELKNVHNRMNYILELVEKEKRKCQTLEFEYDIIRDFCAEAAVFLMESSIKSKADPYQQEIENLIRDEENKATISGKKKMCYELKALLTAYKNTVTSIKEDIKEHRRTISTADQLLHKINNLSRQKNCGEQVKQLIAFCTKHITEFEK